MSQNSAKMLEEYRSILRNDPNSQCFSLLSEALRKDKQVNEAIRVAQKGLQRHPTYSAGRVALARAYMEKQAFDLALSHLKIAAEGNPKHILLYKLMADCHKQLKNIPEVVQNYKIILLLQPHNTTAQTIVQKLEPLISSQYAEDLPGTPPSRLMEEAPLLSQGQLESKAEHLLAFARAYISQDELKEARLTLQKGLQLFPEDISLKKQWEELSELLCPSPTPPTHSALEVLQHWLQRIEAEKKKEQA